MSYHHCVYISIFKLVFQVTSLRLKQAGWDRRRSRWCTGRITRHCLRSSLELVIHWVLWLLEVPLELWSMELLRLDEFHSAVTSEDALPQSEYLTEAQGSLLLASSSLVSVVAALAWPPCPLNWPDVYLPWPPSWPSWYLPHAPLNMHQAD